MRKVAIVGGGPEEHIPVLDEYNDEEVIWIGADHGAISLIRQGIRPTYALGDFDSITDDEMDQVVNQSEKMEEHPVEKDETDLEIALKKALEYEPHELYLFGVTGGRLDHELSNLQLLYPLDEQNIRGIIIDKSNWVELKRPGTYEVLHNEKYPYLSFIPFTPVIYGLTLSSFYYPLEDATVKWGSTLCISNKLISEKGTFSFHKGILLLVKSRDVKGE